MLPGEKRAAEPNQVCEICDCPAVVVLCTESDSFGDETLLLCKTHNEERTTPAAESDRHCEKCGSDEEVKPMRDMEEGSHGPVYWWCAPCRIAFNKAMREAWCPEDEDEDDGWEY